MRFCDIIQALKAGKQPLRVEKPLDCSQYPITSVQMALTHDCPFGCVYCYDKHARNSQNDMPIETARRTIDYFGSLLAEQQNPSHSLLFSLSASGEPLLKWEFTKEVARYARLAGERLGIKVDTGFNTNGLLLTEEIVEEAANEHLWYSLSWDGHPGVQNCQRPLRSGGPTAEYVSRAYGLMSCALTPSMGVGVYVANLPNKDAIELPEAFSYLYDQGVRVMGTRPVRDRTYGINEQSVEKFKDTYSRLAEMLLTSDDVEERFRSLVRHDWLMRFIRGVVRHEYSPIRCPAGRISVAVDSDGLIYSCQDFLGSKEHAIGDVFNGIDAEKRREHSALACTANSHCSNCWARFLCGGCCISESAREFDDLHKPYEPICELTKFTIELAAQVADRLQVDHPALLEEIFRHQDQI